MYTCAHTHTYTYTHTTKRDEKWWPLNNNLHTLTICDSISKNVHMYVHMYSSHIQFLNF